MHSGGRDREESNHVSVIYSRDDGTRITKIKNGQRTSVFHIYIDEVEARAAS
ncbi:hypothetical protein FRC03_010831 [Tulasnella sp. 419]|nr:hypothetical protein FRC03_010831 [Tulasnella sp. 419]